ncbi:MAG: hemolysin family protein [Patescibacteria group bacterium]
MFSLLLLSFVLLVGSAFCSSSEAALFSVSIIKVQALASNGTKAAKNLLKVKENISEAISTLVILNNVFNVVGSIIVGAIAAHTFDELGIGIYSTLFSLAIIIFGEVVPKNFGEKKAESIALTIAGPVILLTRILKPIIFLLDKVTRLFVGKTEKNLVSEEEIRFMADIGMKEQSIEKDEQQLIQNVFKMNDKTARDIMTPRVNVDALEEDRTLGELKSEIYELTHSRLLVYGEDYDEIRGFVLLRELLQALAEDKIDLKPTDFMHPIVSVKETTRVDNLLIMFQKRRTHVALVVDEFGGTSGLVTLEDVLEELVGEIVDETDEVVDMREVKIEA